ncbi:MAG: hypothetical protein ABIQ30_12130 [Devosia sp.]
MAGASSAPAADTPDRFVLPSSTMHEIFTDAPRNAGATLGFSLAATRGLLSANRPVVLYLQLAGETAETGLPYAPGFLSFGIDPDAVILIRVETIVQLLWAAEEALACHAVAAVIADICSDPKAMDFTASRRLGMRATEAGGTFLLLRYGLGRTATAARLRWHIMPEISGEKAYDAKAPGDSRWRLKLEKGLWRGKPNEEWLLSWTGNGFDILPLPDTDRAPAAAPLPRALPSPMGHRLSQTA